MKTVFCLACESELQTEEIYTPHIQGHEFSVCQACRRHIEIGKLVEAMPKSSAIIRDESDFWAYDVIEAEAVSVGETPLEALTKGRTGGSDEA